MESIRTYNGKVFLCKVCGQPCHKGPDGLEHFKEQWDGIFCPWFPLAYSLLEVEWNVDSLKGVKTTYPDTYPHLADAAAAEAGR